MSLRVAAVFCAALPLVVTSGCSGHAARASSQVHLTDPVGDVLLAATKSTDTTAKNADIVAADIRRTSLFLQVGLGYHHRATRASRQWGRPFLVATSKGGDYISSISTAPAFAGRPVQLRRWSPRARHPSVHQSRPGARRPRRRKPLGGDPWNQ